MSENSELDETFELTEEQEFQLWKESVKADILQDVKENK